MLLHPVAPNSDDWRRLRSTGIGASDAGTVWNVGFIDMKTLIEQKRQYRAGTVPKDQPTFKMRYGHYAEDGICQYAYDRLNDIGHMIDLWVSSSGIYAPEDMPYLLATPDRLGSNKNGAFVFDSKNSGLMMTLMFKKKPQLKMSYWIQAQQQMMCTESHQAYMGINFSNDRFVIWHIDRDDEFVERHRQAVTTLWDIINDDDLNQDKAVALATERIIIEEGFLDQCYRKTCAIISDEE